MKSIVNITILLLVVAVCIGCFCIPASAQWISPDYPLEDYSSANRLLLPYRVTARLSANGETYGVVTNISPSYAVPLPNPDNLEEVSQSSSYTQSNIQNSGSLDTSFQNAFKTFNQRTYNLYTKSNIFPDGVLAEYINQFWFGNSTNYGSAYVKYQYDFPAFYIDPDVGMYPWYSFDDPSTSSDIFPVKSCGCLITYAIFEDGNIKLHTDQFAISSSGHFSYEILSKLTKTPYLTNGDMYVASLSLGCENTRGYFQFRQSPTNVKRDVHVASPDTLVANYIVDYDDFNLLEWLSTSADAFLNTPLFDVGGLQVSLGGVVGMILGILAFIAFLKRYAGG